MILLQDTREKTPLEIVDPEVCSVKICKLEVGDYCVEHENGEISATCFERKSLADLFGSLSANYPRFKEEVMRAKELGITLILIVECSFTKVLGGYKHSTVSGVSILKTMFSLWARYGVFPVFCKDREEVAQYIVSFYAAEWRHKKTLDKKAVQD